MLQGHLCPGLDQCNGFVIVAQAGGFDGQGAIGGGFDREIGSRAGKDEIVTIVARRDFMGPAHLRKLSQQIGAARGCTCSRSSGRKFSLAI